MTDLIVHPAERPLEGSVPVPSDKSIGHRALLFSAICHGRSEIDGLSWAADNASTAAALGAMGVTIERDGERTHVAGVGLFGLREPKDPLDCGNSGTTMRLFTGLLSPQTFPTVLVGDASLSRRPMMRVVGPLRSRGARIEGKPHAQRPDDLTAPLHILGLPEGSYLGPLEHDSKVASAQVKSALLISGLYAHGVTRLNEPTLSRDHTERMMMALGVPIQTVGTMVELDPAGWRGAMSAFHIRVPGDPSAAAFPLVAGQLVPGSRVAVRDVGVNPTRTGLIEIARDMGAGLSVEAAGESAGEPVALIHAWHAPLSPGKIGGERVARAIDEIPIACALAARAHGETTIRDAHELRVKESDRIATMVSVLRAFGVTCEELPDGLVVQGRQDPLEPADVESHGDHRIAMTAVVLGLLARGPSRVRDVDCIATSFPRFVGTMRALGARIDVEGGGGLETVS